MFIRYVKLYFHFIKQIFKSKLEYRVDFIIGIISSLIVQLTGLLFIWLIFQNVKKINGWSFYEVTFLYGIMALCKGLYSTFFSNLWVLGRYYIRGGRFDTLLLRPISSLFHLLANYISIDSIGDAFIGLVIIIKSAYELNISFNILNILMFILFIVSGSAILAAIDLISSSFAFWTVNSNYIMWTVNSLSDLAQYPIGIYNKYIKALITWIIPYAFTSFFPSNYFINKGYYHLSFLSPLVAIILWITAIKFWNFGVKNYTSTGS